MLPNGETKQTSDMTFILTRGGYMLLLTVCACTCAIAAAFFSAKLASEFAAKVRSLVFGKVETFSIAEIDHFSTASLITRSTNDINQIQHVTLMTLRTGLIAPITLIGGFIMSAEKSFYMTSVIFYDLPILIIASLVAGKVVYPLFQVIQQKVDRLTLVAREGLTGIRVVRAFNKQATENEKFDEVNESLTKTAVVVNKWCAVLAPLISVVMNCSMVGVVWRASQQIAGTVDKGDVNVGDMMAVIQYMTQIMLALVMVATVILLIPRAIASAKRINEVLETELSLTDSDTPNTNYTAVGTVEFRNVNFKFSEKAEKNILTDIDFTARKGEVTAIVGGTGSGKSAVINLIPRFYDVMEGEVLVDGVNVKEIPIKELREKIGFVPQRSVLFSGTIRDNLCYGKEDATNEEIWEALEIAQSDTFVRDKENGIETRVEQGGGNFSGGQKQRLAIARAIIRKPEVLIFDDSFSALDFRTDKNLRAALKKITKDSATIIVAQRIGTIMDADNIIVLDEGKIVGQGKHEYLIKECKLYRDIALSQMSEEELGL
ncbi:MAG: ABC transporter ATP-binding protein [Clostridia bacterium]|nr:ABC transporter ATP-binding protein [Clostridia bacterium]